MNTTYPGLAIYTSGNENRESAVSIDNCKAPQAGKERDAFVHLQPSGFQIRHPPPPHELDSYITPDSHLFQTLHMGAAVIDESKYLVVVNGLVAQPFALTLAQLKQLPQTWVTAFHECYGSPLIPPTEALWRVGNVRWTGVQLSHLLSLAGIAPSNAELFVWSEGLDSGVFAGIKADRYQKDLPLEKAKQPEVLVAYEMNGEPLTKERGGPVRLVVPGYFGTNSTKWLCRLSVQDYRAPGPYTTIFYNEVDTADSGKRIERPVWKTEVNSMITRPKPNEMLLSPDTMVQGWCWSDSGVKRVDVSANGGKTWVEASVEARVEYEWQRFNLPIHVPSGSHSFISRATSISGKQQPLIGRRNRAHSVDVMVV